MSPIPSSCQGADALLFSHIGAWCYDKASTKPECTSTPDQRFRSTHAQDQWSHPPFQKLTSPMEGEKSLDLLSTIRELVDLNPHTGPWNALGAVQETGIRKDSAFALGT